MAKKKPALKEAEPIESTDLLPNDQLVKIFGEIHTEAEDAYRPIQDVTDVAWNAYNNLFDFSDKDDEQSQAWLPIYKSAIRVAKTIVRRSLLSTPDYFEVEGINNESRELEEDVKEGLSRVADQAAFKEQVSIAAFGGFLENLAVLKEFPQAIEEGDDLIHRQQRVKMIVAPVSVQQDFRLDPLGRNLYVLHRSVMDLCDYEEQVDQGEYEKDSLDFARAGFSSMEEEFKKALKEGRNDPPRPSWRKEVELWEVWCRALINDEGKAVARNHMFTILNRQHVARKATPYLFRVPRPPFVWSPVADKPYSVYHENFGEPVLGILSAIIDLMNSLVDAAQNVATNGFDINVDRVKNANEVSRGIYGGKVIKTMTPPIPGLKAIETFEVGKFSPEAMAYLQYLMQQFQNGIGVTELLSGTPGAGEKTATEIKSKTAAAMGQMSEVSSLLDQYLIGPGLRLQYETMLAWNPEVFGDRLAFQTSRDKLKFRFHISGISGALKQQTELEELLFVIKTLMGTPLATKLNWDYIGEELFRRKGFKAADFLMSQIAQPAEVGTGLTRPQLEASNAREMNASQMMSQLQ